MVWRSSILPILNRRGIASKCLSYTFEAPVSKRAAMVRVEGLGVILTGAAIGADLGGSSKYSREILT